MDFPLVSIGLVAYNREQKIGRAIESVLSQDYQNIELIISNDFSTDNTHDTCLAYAKKDGRVRYFNQKVNLGMTQNFVFVQKEAKGDFFMWLSDDDWLDKDYISKCIKSLRNKEYSLVCGKTRFYKDDTLLNKEDVLNINDNNSEKRVIDYFKSVGSNVILYGLMPMEVINKVVYKNTFGADLLVSAQVVFQGKVRTLEDTFFNYSEGGISNSSEKLAQYYGFNKKQALHPYRVLVKSVFLDVFVGGPIYQSLPLVQRFILALQAALVIRERFAQFQLETKIRSNLKIRTRFKKMIGK